MIPILKKAEPIQVRWWKCPSCLGVQKTTTVIDRPEIGEVSAQAHHCPAQNNMLVILTEVKHPDDDPNARHVLIPKENEAGVQAVATERKDGSNDLNIFVPNAVMSAEALEPE